MKRSTPWATAGHAAWSREEAEGLGREERACPTGKQTSFGFAPVQIRASVGDQGPETGGI